MKYKICPRCGRHNSPTAFDCEACYTDLTGVRVVDERTEQAAQTASPAQRTVRICEACGFSNPANARKCRACGEDISDVTPSTEAPAPESQEENNARVAFEALDGSFSFELPQGVTVIGREEAMSDYLQNKSYVSRRHAQVTVSDDKVTLLNLSKSNYTFVNNKRYMAETVELHDGDEIGLGGNNVNGQSQKEAAYFVVRIGSCS